ncbi:MAG TPA: hemerythrin domain-containing protein [Micromonosporaceae bacterium]
MCNYCGCREFPVIAKLTAEHLAIQEVAGSLARSLRDGDLDAARPLLAELTDLLEPHTRYEERSLFAGLRHEPDMAETVDELYDEHDAIDEVLQTAGRDGIDAPILLAVVERLYRHIDKEEHGIFPAAVVLLDMSSWDEVSAVG